jgi:hypothetical protein
MKDNININIRGSLLNGWEVDGIGSRSCKMASFCVSDVELSNYVTTLLAN